MKKKTILQMIAMFLTIVLMMTSVGIENISAFWVNGSDFGSQRNLALVTVRLMKCYHKEKDDPEYSKHYDSNGNHMLSNEAIKQDEEEWIADSKNNKNKTADVKHFPIRPRVIVDTGTSCNCLYCRRPIFIIFTIILPFFSILLNRLTA